MTPGLLMMTVINNAYMNVSASFFLLKFQRSLDELIVSPMPPFVIILGYAMGGVLRGCITGALVFVVSCFFAPLQVSHPLWVVMIVGLTALCFALAGLINGILAKKFDDINIVPTFILTPLTYLGGVFYSLDTLKPVWKYLSYLNPVVYMVNGLRYGFLGVSDVQISWSFEFLCVLVCIAYGVAHTLLLSGRGLKS
jgi:ABC-2 type transport system permease protein